MYDNLECYDYSLVDLNEIDEQSQITINKENTLEYRIIYVSKEIEYTMNLILTINGNSLTFEMEQTTNGALIESISYNYTKSTVDVDSFVLCSR